jgi:hypothetical protein
MTAYLAWALWHPTVASGQEPANPAQDELERQAVAAIERLDGSVYRDLGTPGEPTFIVTFHRPVSNAELKLLEALPVLKSLSVTGITNDDLAYLSTLKRLEQLSIQNSPITDADLKLFMGRLNLRRVYLSNTKVTSAGTARLKEGLPYAFVIVRENSEEVHEGHNPVGFFLTAALVLLVGSGLAVFLFRTSWGPVQRRRWLWKMQAVATPVVLIAACLLWFAHFLKPVEKGDAAEFWMNATQLDVGIQQYRPSMGGVYQPRDGWCIYYSQGFHGQTLYRVRTEKVATLFPKVVERLEKAPPGVLNQDVEQGYREWVRTGAGPNDVAGFLAKVRDVRLARIQNLDPRRYEYIRTEEDDFDDRWSRIGRYHWNLCFEFLFLSFLIGLVAWPWLRRSGRIRWAIHISVIPILFCLPYWLGYCPYTFTSANSKGGILYPYLLSGWSLPWTSIDLEIVRSLPQILSPLSQTAGPMMSLSFSRGPAPIAVAVLGMVAGLSVFVVKTLIDREHSKNPKLPAL